MSDDYKTDYSRKKNINTLNKGSFTDYGDNTPARQSQLASETLDIDGNPVLSTTPGKTLKNLYEIAVGIPDGTDAAIIQTNPISQFEVLRYFFEGSEQYNITLGFNDAKTIGFHKNEPTDNITQLLFQQNLSLGNEPIGSTYGIFLAVGGKNVTFTILDDPSGLFSLVDGNLLKSTAIIPEGTYELIVLAESAATSSQYTEQITVEVFATALISNINLSSLIVEDDAIIGTNIAAVSAIGGEGVTFELISQTLLGNPVDVMEIVGNELKTKALVGNVGDVYVIAIKAIDSRALPIDVKEKIEIFNINVVLNAFVNNTAFVFNGIDKHFEAPDSPSMGTKTKFTVCGWAAPDNKGSSQYVTSKFGAAGQRSWGLRINNSGAVAFVFSETGVASDTKTSSAMLPWGVYSHIAVVFDGTLPTSEVTFYIDGVADSNYTTTLNSLFNSNVDFLIGAIYNDTVSVTSYYDGILDEFYFYDDALDATAIAAIYNAGAPKNNETLGSAATMVSGFRLGDLFSAGTMPDIKGSNDMTAVNINNGDKTAVVP